MVYPMTGAYLIIEFLIKSSQNFFYAQPTTRARHLQIGECALDPRSHHIKYGKIKLADVLQMFVPRYRNVTERKASEIILASCQRPLSPAHAKESSNNGVFFCGFRGK